MDEKCNPPVEQLLIIFVYFHPIKEMSVARSALLQKCKLNHFTVNPLLRIFVSKAGLCDNVAKTSWIIIDQTTQVRCTQVVLLLYGI